MAGELCARNGKQGSSLLRHTSIGVIRRWELWPRSTLQAFGSRVTVVADNAFALRICVGFASEARLPVGVEDSIVLKE